MTVHGWLVFLCFVIGPGLGWAVDEFWRDRRERRSSAAAKLALIVAWPLWGPVLGRRAGRVGPAAFAASLLLLPLAAALLALAGWVGGNMLSYRRAAYAAQAHLQAEDPEPALAAAERMADIARNIRAVPLPGDRLGRVAAMIAEHHGEVLLQAHKIRIARLCRQKLYPEAERLARETLLDLERTAGRRGQPYAAALSLLAGVRILQGATVEPETLLQEAFAVLEKSLDPKDVRTAQAAHQLARFYAGLRRYEDSLRWYERARDLLAQGPDPSGYLKLVEELDAVKRLAPQRP